MDPSTDVRARKVALRDATLAARRAMDARAREAASRAISTRLLALPELAGVRVIALYAAIGAETDVSSAVDRLRAGGGRTLFPRVRGEHLELVEARNAGDLRPGFRGIAEPLGVAISPSLVDAVVLPGVAFDPHGGRLGQGGGHYDRLLTAFAARTLRIGVCFACQMVPVVPREAHDGIVDVVVTDHAVHRPPRPRDGPSGDPSGP